MIVILHDFTENYVTPATLNEQSVIECLKNMSESKTLRNAWKAISTIKNFSEEVQVAVLERICTMFLKSKQQIIREKLNLKPQKGREH